MSCKRVLAVLVAVIALAGCTSSGSSTPPATTSGSSSPTPSPSPTPPDVALHHLASLAAQASYQATYVARQSHPRSAVTWRVWRTPSALRIDVVTHRQRATLIVTSTRSYSCNVARGHRTCFLVARGGGAVPRPFQLEAQRLFGRDLVALRQDLGSYRVAAAHGSGCFAVHPASHAKHAVVTPGTYCLTATGVVQAVTFDSGNSVRLEHQAGAPSGRAFRPYASPTPVAHG